MAVSLQELQNYSMFGGVSDAAIEFILEHVRLVEFASDEVIFRSGDNGDEICFILDGEVSIRLDGVELAALQKGEQFGEMHLIDVMPRSANVIGTRAGRLLILTNKDLLKLRQFDHEAFVLLLMNCSRDISRRLRIMSQKYAKLAVNPTDG